MTTNQVTVLSWRVLRYIHPSSLSPTSHFSPPPDPPRRRMFERCIINHTWLCAGTHFTLSFPVITRWRRILTCGPIKRPAPPWQHLDCKTFNHFAFDLLAELLPPGDGRRNVKLQRLSKGLIRLSAPNCTNWDKLLCLLSLLLYA